MQQLFNKKLEQRVEAKLKEHIRSGGSGKQVNNEDNGMIHAKGGNGHDGTPTIKSPSDTMVYVPAVKKSKTYYRGTPEVTELVAERGKIKENEFMNKIANFVESIRMSDDATPPREEAH